MLLYYADYVGYCTVLTAVPTTVPTTVDYCNYVDYLDYCDYSLSHSHSHCVCVQVWIAGYEPGTHIDFDVDAMAYSDFVDKEYIIMAVQSNLRGIPHVIDGFKPSQRKILFACLKRKLHSEIKVAQVRVLKVHNVAG